MKIEIAEKVIDHLRKFPFGYPSTPDGDERKLLEMPFELADEEGELLSNLMPYSEHIDAIAQRLGRKKEDLLPLLDNLLHKTWVLRTGPKEDGYYQAMTWAPGAVELQMPWLTKDLVELHGRMTPLDHTKEPTELIPHFRVIPREAALPATGTVLPSETVSLLIDQAADGELAVTECICRKTEKLHGRGCHAPIEDQCLFLGAFATTILELGAGRTITKDEAKQKIKKAQELGLIHQANANARPLAICSCCTCCCGTLRPLLAGHPQPSLKSNFSARSNIDACKGTCPDCVKACPAKALSIGKKSGKVATNPEKCIGCGLCVAACSEKALFLIRKEHPFEYPDTWDDYLRVRATQSGRADFYK
jgi:Na+-translocating ferredoxin:NAD+ oxidoreductase subunit B